MKIAKSQKTYNSMTILTFQVTPKEDKMDEVWLAFLASRVYREPNHLIHWNKFGGQIIHRSNKKNQRFIQMRINSKPQHRGVTF
jgi:hypothetical protein